MQTDHMRIAERQIQITPEWFSLHGVPRDGNCLFHAVHAQTRIPIRTLRTLAWAELQEPRYQHALPEPPRDANFAWEGPYGDAAPYALSRALCRTIFIVTGDVGYFIHPDEGRTESPIYLFLRDGHYDMLVPKEPMLRWEDKFYDHTKGATMLNAPTTPAAALCHGDTQGHTGS